MIKSRPRVEWKGSDGNGSRKKTEKMKLMGSQEEDAEAKEGGKKLSAMAKSKSGQLEFRRNTFLE